MCYFRENVLPLYTLPLGPSCCTPDMELRMRHKSSLEYREAVNNKTTVMANPFQTKARITLFALDYSLQKWPPYAGFEIRH